MGSAVSSNKEADVADDANTSADMAAYTFGLLESLMKMHAKREHTVLVHLLDLARFEAMGLMSCEDRDRLRIPKSYKAASKKHASSS